MRRGLFCVKPYFLRPLPLFATMDANEERGADMWIIYLAAALIAASGIYGLYYALVMSPDKRKEINDVAESANASDTIFTVIAVVCYASIALVWGVLIGYVLGGLLILHYLWIEWHNRNLKNRRELTPFHKETPMRLVRYGIVGILDLAYALLFVLSMALR